MLQLTYAWCNMSTSGLLHPQSNAEDGRQALLFTEQWLWNDVLIRDRSVTVWWRWLKPQSHSQRHIQLCANQQAGESRSQQHCRSVNYHNNIDFRHQWSQITEDIVEPSCLSRKLKSQSMCTIIFDMNDLADSERWMQAMLQYCVTVVGDARLRDD